MRKSSELQAEVNHFTANPKQDSPSPGFDIVIVPEELTATDDQAVADVLQAKIDKQWDSPYIRPIDYNDPRIPEPTGKGYRLAFAPRHYNVPSGPAAAQTSWMQGKNQETQATQLQTANDSEALAQVNNLHQANQLDVPSTRLNRSYFKRFDQAPFGGFVSSVYVYDNGGLRLGRSNADDDGPTRALVVPKLKA